MTTTLALIIFAVLVFCVAIGVPLLSYFIGRKPMTPEKSVPYECGMDPIEQEQGLVSVKFYKIALIFVIFDVETIFIYLWAVSAEQTGVFGLIEIIVFIAILFIPLLYAWHKGDLQWE
ncbi:MAG TPA: NADH-quinone oxidoreductase subunit A [Smithellaceae bacterium]|nr:NADH-quinone oxidoreductase subunit A [Smithellaceae bacterium]